MMKERRRRGSWIAPLLNRSPNMNPPPSLSAAALQLVLPECMPVAEIFDICEKDVFTQSKLGTRTRLSRRN